MFSWFLKLIGIDEDKPSASGNSYLDTSLQSNSNDADSTKAPIVETTTEPETTPEPEATPEPEPTPEPEHTPELDSSPEPAPKSLSDEFPDLKSNYIKVLNEAGFTSKALVAKASDKELLDLKGIGKATLKLLRT